MSNVTKVAVIQGGGALPTSVTLIPQTNDGQQFNVQYFQRIFSAAEIGNGAGQTQHDNGLLAVSIEAGRILAVTSLMTLKTVGGGAGWHQIVTNAIIDGQNARTNRSSFNITDNGKSLRWKDEATHADLRVAAGDYLMIGLIIGGEGSETYLPPLVRA